MNCYKIEFNKLVQLLLPVVLRGKVLIGFLNALIIPVAKVNVLLQTFRGDVQYRLKHNSQVCHLQKMLNDTFDGDNRSIWITDATVSEWGQFIWKEETDRPAMLGVFFLNRENFIGSNAIDFLVHVPRSLQLSNDDYNRMGALLRSYKLAGKRFLILEKI